MLKLKKNSTGRGNVNITQFINYARKFVIALAAALAILAVVIQDGITASEWIQVAISFIGALGVYSVPNKEIK